jgi:lysyl-tRNA synthetase class 2
LLAAMDAGLPDCSGCALGVDRFLCVLLATAEIDDVIAFPTELA